MPEVAERVEAGNEQLLVRRKRRVACCGCAQEVIDPCVLLLKAAGQPLVSLGSELESDLLSLGNLLDQLKCAGPGECLVQPPFDGPFQSIQQPRRQRFQSGLEPLVFLVEQGVVLTETGWLTDHLEEYGTEVVDDHASVGPDLLGTLAYQERRALPGLADSDQFFANRREETHHQVPRIGLNVLDQCQMSDQFVHGRTDLVRMAPRRPGQATRPTVSAPRPPGPHRGSVPPGGPSVPGRPTSAIDDGSHNAQGDHRVDRSPRSQPCEARRRAPR